MANQKILAKKKEVVDEIATKIKESASVVVFEYHGLTVAETNELRRKLRAGGSDLKNICWMCSSKKPFGIEIEVETSFPL